MFTEILTAIVRNFDFVFFQFSVYLILPMSQIRKNVYLFQKLWLFKVCIMTRFLRNVSLIMFMIIDKNVATETCKQPANVSFLIIMLWNGMYIQKLLIQLSIYFCLHYTKQLRTASSVVVFLIFFDFLSFEGICCATGTLDPHSLNRVKGRLLF